MARRFEVIGEDEYGDNLSGDVMGARGDVMGYGGPMGNYDGNVAVLGYTPSGYPIVSGAGRARGYSNVQVHKPGWRESQLAPGVIAPDQGLLTLPMGNFTYTAALQTNTFQGQVQKPFRGERFLSRVVRTGTTAIGTILAQIFVGTDLSQLDVASVDLESISNPQAFGVRLTMKPAQPGVFIRVITTLSVVLTTTDTIAVSLQLLGRNIH
jgi:hypothetical protein